MSTKAVGDLAVEVVRLSAKNTELHKCIEQRDIGITSLVKDRQRAWESMDYARRERDGFREKLQRARVQLYFSTLVASVLLAWLAGHWLGGVFSE